MGCGASKVKVMMAKKKAVKPRHVWAGNHLDIVNALQFEERDYLNFREAYQTIIDDRPEFLKKDANPYLTLMDILAFLDVERTPFTVRAFAIMDTNLKGHINFSQFLVGIWNFGSLEAKALEVFLFGLYDLECRGYIELPELKGILEEAYGTGDRKQELLKQVMAEAGRLALKIEVKKKVGGAVETIKFLEPKQFTKLQKMIPSFLQPAFLLHRKVRKRLISEAAWEKYQKHRIEWFAHPEDLDARMSTLGLSKEGLPLPGAREMLANWEWEAAGSGEFSPTAEGERRSSVVKYAAATGMNHKDLDHRGRRSGSVTKSKNSDGDAKESQAEAEVANAVDELRQKRAEQAQIRAALSRGEKPKPSGEPRRGSKAFAAAEAGGAGAGAGTGRKKSATKPAAGKNATLEEMLYHAQDAMKGRSDAYGGKDPSKDKTTRAERRRSSAAASAAAKATIDKALAPEKKPRFGERKIKRRRSAADADGSSDTSRSRRGSGAGDDDGSDGSRDGSDGSRDGSRDRRSRSRSRSRSNSVASDTGGRDVGKRGRQERGPRMKGMRPRSASSAA